MNKFDMMSKDALSRVEEIMNATKLNEFLHRKEEEEKQKNCILWILLYHLSADFTIFFIGSGENVLIRHYCFRIRVP